MQACTCSKQWLEGALQAAAHGAIRRRLGGMQTAPDHDVQDMMSDLFETITTLGATYRQQSLATTGPPAHSYLAGGSADWVLLISSLPPVSPQVPLALLGLVACLHGAVSCLSRQHGGGP